ncbi:MAG TPA: acyltransferase family protein [Ramlibacter sp.]|uniref:acyltransferase family protein n=1 Tax=Ramlibacter sp. TaxID=1917967 RepID=UPI002ED5FEEF
MTSEVMESNAEASPAAFLSYCQLDNKTSPSLSSRFEYRPDIDGLRAIAVLAVIGFHAFPEAVRGGFVGVDVFFVISGYLISGIILKSLDERSFSLSGFYSRRIRRIFPALILVLSACLIAGWTFLFADEYKHLGLHAAGGSVFASNFLLWSEAGYFDQASTTKPLLHLWSLGIEEQFYLAWPLLLLVLYRIGSRCVPWAIAGIAFSSFLAGAITVDSNPVAAFYSPAPRLWEFLAGTALAARSDRIDRFFGTRSRNLRSAVGIAFIATAIFVFDTEYAFPGWWALLPVGGAFLVISAGAGQGANRTLLSTPLLVGIGLISYPLYLWHWPLISFAYIAESGHPGVVLRSMAVAASLFAAWLTYRFVETPVRHGPNPRVPLRLVALVLTVGGAGFLVSHLDGIPTRGSLQAQHFDLEKIGKERLASMRAGFCHFHLPEDTLARRAIGDCLALDDHRKNILIVGDSHAFDLRTSLSQAYPEVNFLQVTGSGCTPIESLYTDRTDRCGDIVRHVKYGYKDLTALDGVILSAKWSRNFRLLAEDIAHFRSLGVRVAVFGPTFEFTGDVPKILARQPSHKPNVMLVSYLRESPLKLDSEMENFFKSIGVSYVSKIRNLCADGICPALDDTRQLLVIDYGHWSVEGAKHYGSLFRKHRVLEKWLQAADD